MESPKTIAHEIGGVQNDALRFGLNGVKSDIVGSHPLESAYQSVISLSLRVYFFISSLAVWFPRKFFDKNPIESLNSSSENLSFGVENIALSVLGVLNWFYDFVDMPFLKKKKKLCISFFFIIIIGFGLVFVWIWLSVIGFRQEEHKTKWRGKFLLTHMEVLSHWRWTLTGKFFHGKPCFLNLT